MVNISKQPIKKETFRIISENLIRYVSNIKTSSSAEKFLGELLTRSEGVMLTKRLAIVIMLEQGYKFNSIEKTLKVCPNTISNIQEKRNNGEFNFIIQAILSRNHKKRKVIDEPGKGFLASLEILLQAGMPPMGRGRWKKTLEMIDEKKHKRW